MYLDAASKAKETVVTEINAVGLNQTPEVFGKWKDWHPSQISHHGKMCCEISREWLTSQDFSESGGSSLLTGPRWLRQRFNWGASSFPIYWCEAVRKKTLDCGALAAFAHEIFTARGIKSYRIQIVQKFSEVSTNQWTSSWNETNEQLPWIENDLIYHEGCAIAVSEGQVKVWDASAGWWINANSGDGYGSLVAIRLSGAGEGATFNWGTHRLVANQWQKIN